LLKNIDIFKSLKCLENFSFFEVHFSCVIYNKQLFKKKYIYKYKKKPKSSYSIQTIQLENILLIKMIFWSKIKKLIYYKSL